MTKRLAFLMAIVLAFAFAMAPTARVTASPPAQSPDCAALMGGETVSNASAIAACTAGMPGGPSDAPSRPYAPEAVLYDNGPYINAPGGAPGGADGSVLQTSLGLNLFGFGHAVSSGFRVADDFVVPAGETWNIESITFVAYQTGSTTTSTINNVNLRIWDGAPNAGGTIIFGDTTTNRLANTVFDNSYRYTDTTPGTTRPLMRNTATVVTTLTAGTYWLDWQTGGTLASGPWVPPVTINGQTTTGNGLQYDPTAQTWNIALDSGTNTPQGLPFIIEGTLVGATPTATVVPPTATVVPPTPTQPPTSIELGGMASGNDGSSAGWLLGLAGLSLIAVGLIARRRR